MPTTENLYNPTDSPQARDRAGRVIEGRTSAYCDLGAPAVKAALTAGRLIRLHTPQPASPRKRTPNHNPKD